MGRAQSKELTSKYPLMLNEQARQLFVLVVQNIVGILSATRHGDEMGGSEGKRWIIEILSHLKISVFLVFYLPTLHYIHILYMLELVQVLFINCKY